MCLIKDGPFSPIRLFCHKYIETKHKSAKSDRELRLTSHIDTE
jgi:hypothetical protein